MSLPFAIAVYFIIWWIVLFAILPFGVRRSEEVGETPAPGTEEGAPHRPQLFPKVIATTVVSAIIFAGVYAIMAHHLIALDDIPFFPRYERVR
jgi:predicted secreted protein